MADKKPSFQFYPGDWMKDPAVQSCSLAARGLWIEMLLLMFESSRRGYLQQANRTPTSPEQLARMTGCDRDEAAHLLQELEDSGVFSRTDNGIIYSRRMTRDERTSQVRREAAKKGVAHKPRDFAGQFAPAKPPAMDQQSHQQKSRSSSSSSSSSSKELKNPSGKPEADSRHFQFREQVDRYWHHKTGEEKAPWDGSEGKALSQLLAAKPDLTVEQFRMLLKHRGDSPAEVQTERPRVWLPNILRYAGGPLDRFGKPLQEKRNGLGLAFVDAEAMVR